MNRHNAQKEAPDLIIESARNMDFTGVKVPVIALYKYPREYPDQFVARLHDGAEPTHLVMLADHLEDLKIDIKFSTHNPTWFSRGAEDDPCLVGCFIL